MNPTQIKVNVESFVSYLRCFFCNKIQIPSIQSDHREQPQDMADDIRSQLSKQNKTTQPTNQTNQCQTLPSATLCCVRCCLTFFCPFVFCNDSCFFFWCKIINNIKSLSNGFWCFPFNHRSNLSTT